MEDKCYKPSESPAYSDTDIRELQNGDRANAETIFNPLFQRLIDNTRAVKQEADAKADGAVVVAALEDKVDKASGMGLSSNDFTDIEKDKLAGIEAGATNYVHPDKHLPSVIEQDADNRFMTDAEKAKVESGTVTTLTHQKSGTTHTLTGTIPTSGYASVRFKAVAVMGTGVSWKVNDIAYTGQTALGELAEDMFAAGVIVAAELDIGARKINFKMGGASTPAEFGDGSDGDLVITSGQTVTLPVVNNGIVIKQYKSIRIDAGGRLTTSGLNVGLILKCKGDCKLDGTIDQSGKNAKPGSSNNYPYPNVVGGRGGNGGNGGNGSNNSGVYGTKTGGRGGTSSNTFYSYPHGGAIGGIGGGGGSGGTTDFSNNPSSWGTGGLPGQNGSDIAGSFPSIVRTVGGAAVRPSYSQATSSGKGGDGGTIAYGGGLVAVYCGGKLNKSGAILCNGNGGGNGGSGATGSNYGGSAPNQGVGFSGGGGGGSGGGGGGCIYINYNATYLDTGSNQVNGGTGGDGGIAGSEIMSYKGAAGVAGNAGAIGTVKVEKYTK